METTTQALVSVQSALEHAAYWFFDQFGVGTADIYDFYFQLGISFVAGFLLPATVAYARCGNTYRILIIAGITVAIIWEILLFQNSHAFFFAMFLVSVSMVFLFYVISLKFLEKSMFIPLFISIAIFLALANGSLGFPVFIVVFLVSFLASAFLLHKKKEEEDIPHGNLPPLIYRVCHP